MDKPDLVSNTNFTACSPDVLSTVMACLLESAGSTFCAFGRLTFPTRLCGKWRMTNQSAFPNALAADQFEDLYPNDEACAEDLFLRR